MSPSPLQSNTCILFTARDNAKMHALQKPARPLFRGRFHASVWPSFEEIRQSQSCRYLHESACLVMQCTVKSLAPSASTSLIMSRSCSSLGFCPILRITVPNSTAVILPSLSLSNMENASRSSVIINALLNSHCLYLRFPRWLNHPWRTESTLIKFSALDATQNFAL